MTAPSMSLFLCGDVMTGRGIDQLLSRPSKPNLYEGYVTDARDYVRLAEQASGPIARPVAVDYIWGDALAEMDRRVPQLRIVNLETAVTTSEAAWPGKGIHYRMHPANIGCLTAARIDACVLANNHVLDWGREGLAETLRVLHEAGIRTAGVGADDAEAMAPAVIELSGGGRLLLFAAADEESGVPRGWGATASQPGVHLLDDMGVHGVEPLARSIDAQRRPGDAVVVSLHWGGNWGYTIDRDQRALAHALVEAGADVVHGHSSHHARGFEVYRQRLVLYGCGDFINDYEGIGGHERYRGDLAVAYFVRLVDGRLRELTLVPFQSHRLSLRRASAAGTRWLFETLNRECRPFNVALRLAGDGSLQLAVGT
jgi:poly-gamma-glutamate capsule biosynthesis protein CapA/YwtB (metallophosphatase superfamily)